MTSLVTSVSDWVTWREIHQQPEVWITAHDQLAPQLAALRSWVRELEITEVWFCGAGTSAYIGEILVATLPRRGSYRFRAVASTDLVASPRSFLDGTNRPLVVSFGRSGNSTETRGTLELLDRLAPLTPRLHVTCNGNSLLARSIAPEGCVQRIIVLPEETHDAGFAMTSSFTTMLLTALAVFGKEEGGALRKSVVRAADAAQSVLAAAKRHLAACPQPERIVFVGSGPCSAVSREAALKVMELTAGAVPALAESSLGFRHGPKSFVTDKTRIVQFASRELPACLYDADLVAELRGQYGQANLTTIGPAGCDVVLPDVGSLQPLLQILWPQIAAVMWSHALGLDVDNPFAGAGTLSRVVAHVTLHTHEG